MLAVIWMAGVSMLTNVILPALHGGALRADWHRAFEAIERRFVYDDPIDGYPEEEAYRDPDRV